MVSDDANPFGTSETVTLTRSDLIYGSEQFENQPSAPTLSYVIKDPTQRTSSGPLLPRFPLYPQLTPDFGYVESLGAQKYESTGTYYDYPITRTRLFAAVHFFYASSRPPGMSVQAYQAYLNASPNLCFFIGHYFSAAFRPALESSPTVSMSYASNDATGFSGQQFAAVTQSAIQARPSICFSASMFSGVGQFSTTTSYGNTCVSSPQLVSGKYAR